MIRWIPALADVKLYVRPFKIGFESSPLGSVILKSCTNPRFESAQIIIGSRLLAINDIDVSKLPFKQVHKLILETELPVTTFWLLPSLKSPKSSKARGYAKIGRFLIKNGARSEEVTGGVGDLIGVLFG